MGICSNTSVLSALLMGPNTPLPPFRAGFLLFSRIRRELYLLLL